MARITLLRKPYTPTVETSSTANFNVYGKSFMQLQAVYLSGEPYLNQTFYNPFSATPKLSAEYPGFFGVKLLSTAYTTNFDNTVTFTLPSAVQPGLVDIIIQNPAGYGTLTRYVVKELYTGKQTVQKIRPWSQGIQVTPLSSIVPPNAVYTITGETLLTISGDYIVTIE